MNRLAVYSAILDALNVSGGPKVGDHTALEGVTPDDIPSLPFGVFYSITGGREMGAPLGDPSDLVMLMCQVTNVGLKPAQAEWMADYTRELLIGRSGKTWSHPIMVPSAKIVWRDQVSFGGAIWQGEFINVVDQYEFGVAFL